MPLVFVPTPLGNLRDITLRALDVLRAATLIVAEDSRVARRLLSAYEAGRARALGKTVADSNMDAMPVDLTNAATPPSPVVERWIDANDALMAKLGLRGTPGIVWHDARGVIQRRAGAPDALLPEILGPR